MGPKIKCERTRAVNIHLVLSLVDPSFWKISVTPKKMTQVHVLCCVTGVLQKSQQWEVYTEGPAGRPDAESPQVPSPSSGTEIRDVRC